MQQQRASGLMGGEWNFLDLQNRKQTGDLEKTILHFRKKMDYKIFNFSCSRGSEGVSTILINLLNYAKLHKRENKILVIDANFQRPVLHKVFNISNQAGLADALNSRSDVSEVCIHLKETDITVMPAGPEHGTLSGSIEQKLFIEVLDACREKYDLIFIDSSPILTSSDALSTATSADLTFLIIRSSRIPKDVALKAKALLDNNECNIGGTISNDVQQVIPNWIYKFF